MQCDKPGSYAQHRTPLPRSVSLSASSTNNFCHIYQASIPSKCMCQKYFVFLQPPRPHGTGRRKSERFRARSYTEERCEALLARQSAVWWRLLATSSASHTLAPSIRLSAIPAASRAAFSHGAAYHAVICMSERREGAKGETITLITGIVASNCKPKNLRVIFPFGNLMLDSVMNVAFYDYALSSRMLQYTSRDRNSYSPSAYKASCRTTASRQSPVYIGANRTEYARPHESPNVLSKYWLQHLPRLPLEHLSTDDPSHYLIFPKGAKSATFSHRNHVQGIVMIPADRSFGHVVLRAPSNSQSEFSNYRKHFIVFLIPLVDAVLWIWVLKEV
ncbi:hypothetical protein PR048_014586 [Dryococelus australis]|uniref:Uncharacterized protein n=1 Tax=Dryococelus australis TaxID=614101 RepID=A0ABQ9HEV4_9NEOP|nr:hypothetical protein PR048_014586 [Dryococelus australis]